VVDIVVAGAHDDQRGRGRDSHRASVLSADLTRVAEQVGQVLAAGADWLHVDVMDGRFVPNLTFGANMVAALRGLTKKPIDVHLMVVEPERYLESFAAAGASVFTFHPEATVHVQRLLAAARGHGMLAGLALNPGSPLQLAEEVVADLDLLLIMTVNPGSAGKRTPRRERQDPPGARAAHGTWLPRVPRGGWRDHCPHHRDGPRGGGGHVRGGPRDLRERRPRA